MKRNKFPDASWDLLGRGKVSPKSIPALPTTCENQALLCLLPLNELGVLRGRGGPELYRDEAYVAELRRRAAILLPAVGWDEHPQIDEPMEAAKKDPSAPR